MIDYFQLEISTRTECSRIRKGRENQIPAAIAPNALEVNIWPFEAGYFKIW